LRAGIEEERAAENARARTIFHTSNVKPANRVLS